MTTEFVQPMQMRFSAYNGSKIGVRFARIRLASDPAPTVTLGNAENLP